MVKLSPMNILLGILTHSLIFSISGSTSVVEENIQYIAKQEFCSCQSTLTLQECWNTRPKCKSAQKIKTILERAAQDMPSRSALETYVSQTITGPWCSPKQKLNVGHLPAWNKKTAAIEVIEFADFSCMHCRQTWPKTLSALKKYAQQVEFYYMPFSFSPTSPGAWAAKAALAAHTQQQFWPMVHLLFQSDTVHFSPEGLETLAKSLKLNSQQFKKDLTSDKIAAQYAIIHQEAERLAIMKTPTYYIQGRYFSPDSYQSLEDRIELEIARDEKACQ
jgi:predicted DsbA family dithiol-disulfide isomerase